MNVFFVKENSNNYIDSGLLGRLEHFDIVAGDELLLEQAGQVGHHDRLGVLVRYDVALVGHGPLDAIEHVEAVHLDVALGVVGAVLEVEENGVALTVVAVAAALGYVDTLGHVVVGVQPHAVPLQVGGRVGSQVDDHVEDATLEHGDELGVGGAVEAAQHVAARYGVAHLLPAGGERRADELRLVVDLLEGAAVVAVPLAVQHEGVLHFQWLSATVVAGHCRRRCRQSNINPEDEGKKQKQTNVRVFVIVFVC